MPVINALLGGIALDRIRFPTSQVASGRTVVLPDLTVAHLGLAAGAFPAVITLHSAVLTWANVTTGRAQG